MVITAACLGVEIRELDLLRTRWYEAQTGRFTSFDDFEGSPSDPSHLHKYLYAGGDPINHIDPSGHDFIELMLAVGINAANYGIRAAPIIKVGFAAWDAYTIINILNTGFTQGFDKVSASDWVQFGLSTVGLVGIGPGSKLLAKTLLSSFLRIPIGPALRTFDGARLAVGQFVKLESWEKLARVSGEALGEFHVYESGEAVIRYVKTGDSLVDAGTFIHEFIHYTSWVLHGKPVGEAYEAYKATVIAYEKSYQAYEKITQLILALCK